MTDSDSTITPETNAVAATSGAAPPAPATSDAPDDKAGTEQLPAASGAGHTPEPRPAEPYSAEPQTAGPDPAGTGTGTGTGAGRSDAPRTVIGAQESSAINANLAGLAAGTVRLGS
jgi:hypothetical protein